MIKQDYTNYIVQRITDICKKYKRREAGSQSARDAADDMAAEAKQYADTVITQDFNVNPRCFIGSIPLFAGIVITAAVVSFVSVLVDSLLWLLIGDALILLGFCIFIPEYVFYRRLLEVVTKKHRGRNVFAVRKARGESKRRIIIGGHLDAAYEMPVMSKFNVIVLYAVLGIGLLGPVITFILNNVMLLNFLPRQVHITFAIIELVCAVITIPVIFFADFNTIVDGANDNLTACFIGMSILKEMAENDFRYENTDVCCLITDGEEAGLRGATAFASENISMLMDKNTVFVALDTIHEKEELRIYGRGINFTEANADEVCDLLYFAGMKHGLDLPYAEFYPGAVDAEAFSREGVKAAGLCGVRHTPAPYYHTVHDTYTNLNPECIELVRDIVKTSIDMFDGAGKVF